MDPQHVWCPNEACPASGQVGQGNIGVHRQPEWRYDDAHRVERWASHDQG